jgi:hypothetical protein
MTNDQEIHRKCVECGKPLPAPKRTPHGKPVGRPGLCCSDTCSKRRRRRTVTEPPPPEPQPSTSHSAAVDALDVAFRAARGGDFSPNDAAELGQLHAVAVALDADPTAVGLLREYRLGLADWRRRAEDNTHGDGLSLAQFLAAAVAEARDS